MADSVLVSGGSGYIAGFLIRQLVTEGWMVHTTVRSLAKESAVRQLLAVDNSRLKFFAADLNADAGWDEAMRGCEVILHEAAIPSVARSIVNPHLSNQVNVTGTIELMLAAARNRVRRVVYAGSSSVYGVPESLPCRESFRPSP